jgi:hypothetical protein
VSAILLDDEVHTTHLDHSGEGNLFPYDPAEFLGFDRFATEHKLHPSGRFPIPFDSYSFQVFAYAMDPATNQSADVARFSIPFSPDGFTVRSHETEVTKKFTCNTDNGPTTVEVKSRMLTVVIRYSVFTLALTMCMFAANWALTLTSLYITFSAMTKGRVTWSAFTLHGTMALAIPWIRKLYLCPPPFGVFLGLV